MKVKIIPNRFLLVVVCGVVAVAFFSLPACANEQTRGEALVDSIQPSLPLLRLAPSDFQLPSGVNLPLTVPSVEQLFAAPLKTPVQSSKWSEEVARSSDTASLLALAAEILGRSNLNVDQDTVTVQGLPSTPQQLPPEVRTGLIKLYVALAKAAPFLKTAVDSVPVFDRHQFLTLYDLFLDSSTPAVQEISARRMKQKYEAMESFNQNSLMKSGAIVLTATDELLSILSKKDWSQAGPRLSHPLPWKTPLGLFLIGGTEDDVYSVEDLKNVVAVIDLGGRNKYLGPVAAAGENEIRLLIDLGSEVDISSQTSAPTAGSGIFGIGEAFFPNSEGVKTITSGSWSEGCGLAGIGVLSAHGEVHLTGDRYVQGAGTFGVGLLQVLDGHDSRYWANRSGQGAGLIRGVGLFFHRGDRTDIKGGLVEPDPREPLGSVSICQGVGFGPRAYGGGGVGLAVLRGDNLSVRGSYFSQGCGYWHGLGIFQMEGSSSTLQARRYDQGSGVHSAFGYFEVAGNDNHIFNWGVGPAYGWDRSVGSAVVVGNDNEIRTDWGATTASIGSLSFSLLKGAHFTLQLPQLGTGGFFRNEFSYSVHALQLQNSALKFNVPEPDLSLRLMPGVWGTAELQGTELAPNLKLSQVDWPPLPREEFLKENLADLKSLLVKAAEKSPIDRLSEMVDVAAAFSLDKETPRQALTELLSLPASEVPLLVDVLEPSAVDQLIQLRILFAAYGDQVVDAVLKASAATPDLRRKLTLLSMVPLFRPSLVLPPVISSLATEPSQATRLTGVGVIGSLFNRDDGEEPGTRAVLSALSAYIKGGPNKPPEREMKSLLARLRFTEAFGLLATCVPLDRD